MAAVTIRSDLGIEALERFSFSPSLISWVISSGPSVFKYYLYSENLQIIFPL